MTPAKSGYKRQPTSYLRILSFILPLILISGCARTFTSRETQLNISIDIAVAGSIDLSANNYYVVFSTTTTPLLPADSAPFIYFPSPGIQFNEPLLITYGGLSTYYNAYYPTWKNYIVAGHLGTQLFQSNSTGFVTPNITVGGETVVATANFFISPSTSFFPTITRSGSHLIIKFPLQQMDPTATQLFIQICTAERTDPTDDSGSFRDRLSSPILINVRQGAQTELTDSEEPSGSTIKPGADLLSCVIEIR